MPVLVGARAPLDEDNLPDDIRWLAELQYLHLPNNFDVSNVRLVVDQLLKRVHAQLDGE